MTIWREQRAGEQAPKVWDVSAELGGAAILYTDRPDWVRHPQTGAQMRVLGVSTHDMDCPQCGVRGMLQALELEGQIDVLECPACRQYLFVRGLREPPTTQHGG